MLKRTQHMHLDDALENVVASNVEALAENLVRLDSDIGAHAVKLVIRDH